MLVPKEVLKSTNQVLSRLAKEAKTFGIRVKKRWDLKLRDVFEWREVEWKAATVRTIAFAIVAYLLAFIWVILLSDTDVEMGSRARAATPFLVGVAAAATFFSVLWRGMIQNNQVLEQKRQNDSKEEADLALLLEKATEHLASENPSKISLGLAMLETIALADNDKYAKYAFELAQDQLVPLHALDDARRGRIINQIGAVLSGWARHPERDKPNYKVYNFSNIYRDCSEGKTGNAASFEVIEGLENAIVFNAVVGVDFRFNALAAQESLYFDSCSFIPDGVIGTHDVQVTGNFDRCNFFDLAIHSIAKSMYSGPNENRFVSCDFSGTRIENPKAMEKLVLENCFFRSDKPPKFRETWLREDGNSWTVVDFAMHQGHELEVRNFPPIAPAAPNPTKDN